MAEPTSSILASVAGWKAIGSSTLGTAIGTAVFASLSALVVMCMMHPRSAKEWAIGIVSTFVGSVCGGAMVIQYLSLAAWMESLSGTIALLGVVFACGLPAWALVRWFFTYVNSKEDKNIVEVIKDMKKDLKDIKDAV